MDAREVLDFLAECGQLKREPRSGWTLAGIPMPESVADHVYRTAVLAHVIATEEDVDPARAVLLALFHDQPETRTGDLHRIASGYLDASAAHATIAKEQLRGDAPWKRALLALVREAHDRESPEAIVARDADRLECFLQGREYEAMGFALARDWWSDKRDWLTTRTARTLYDTLVEAWDPTAWRRDLKREG